MNEEELKELADAYGEKTEDNHSEKLDKLIEHGNIILNTDHGEIFIDLLAEMYLMSPVSPAGYTERASCIREGHNELVRFMINIKNKKRK